jgi:hypothetical protein
MNPIVTNVKPEQNFNLLITFSLKNSQIRAEAHSHWDIINPRLKSGVN